MKKYKLLLASLFIAGAAPVYAQIPIAPQTAPAAEVQQFQKLEDQWSIAEVKRDQYTMELLLSPVYVGISSKGDISTRNQQIAALFDRTSAELTSMEQKVVSVRTFGDLAVVEGTYILKHHENGNTIEDRGIFTHVFQKIRSNWLCVNAQRTLVVQQSDEKPAKISKKSDAPLPFHIPLLHKGSTSNTQANTNVEQQPQ